MMLWIQRKKITIKSYDEEERASKGSVVFPIRVRPIEKDVVFQVLDLNLAYNILLGRSWIHAMQEVPSVYHQCLNFSHNSQEITNQGGPNPF